MLKILVKIFEFRKAHEGNFSGKIKPSKLDCPTTTNGKLFSGKAFNKLNSPSTALCLISSETSKNLL
jgi:hypothetical protein